MTPVNFNEEIDDFIHLACWEYARDVKILKIDYESMIAEIQIEDFHGNTYKIPLGVSSEDELIIDASEYVQLNADNSGLYVFLWGFAQRKSEKLEKIILEAAKECEGNDYCPFCFQDLRKPFNCKNCNIDHMGKSCYRQGEHKENCIVNQLRGK